MGFFNSFEVDKHAFAPTLWIWLKLITLGKKTKSKDPDSGLILEAHEYKGKIYITNSYYDTP